MPLIYRPRAQPVALDTATPPRSHSVPVPTDADDSIVLSDLVRQGEASRLRRRGAMRLEHGPMGAQPTAPTQDPVDNPPTITIGSPVWESEPEPEPEDGQVLARNTNTDRERGYRSAYGYGGGRARVRGDACEDGDEFGYTLFCGSEESDSEMDIDMHQSFWHTGSYEPSMLPLYPNFCPSASSSSRRPRPRHVSGCGALLHMHASPRRRLGVWTAKNEASTGAVIGLDAGYFDRSAVAKIVRSACGCVREGVGCAVCGNPLGTRYKPCKTAAEGIFSSPSHSRPHPSSPLHPEGPRYWHAQSRSTRPFSFSSSPQPTSSTPESHTDSNQSSPSQRGTKPSSPFYVYTFFSTSVSSSPAFKFPPRPTAALPLPAADPQPQPQPQPIRTPYQLQLQSSYSSQDRTQADANQSAQLTTNPLNLVPIDASSQPQATPLSAVPTSDGDTEGDQAGVSANNENERPETPAFAVPTLSPPGATLLFDRGLTASPSPLSDSGDASGVREVPETLPEETDVVYSYSYQYREADTYPYPYQALEGAERRTEIFDPDGEFIAEPESPDKTGEVMLFPER